MKVVDVDGVNAAVTASVHRIVDLKVEAADIQLQDEAVRAIKTAKYYTGTAQAVHTGMYKAAWHMKKLGKHKYVILNDTPYAIFLEYGRPPGMEVPDTDAIYQWIKGKIRAGVWRGDVPATDEGLMALASKVAASIEKDGYAPRWIRQSTLKTMKKRTRKAVKRAVRAMRGDP